MFEEAGLPELRKKYLEEAKSSQLYLPENLILSKSREARHSTPVYINWASTTGRDVLFEAEATRLFVQHFHPNPKVYYFGIGNPSRLNIDIIWPLLICDFSELIATDIEPGNGERFALGPREFYNGNRPDFKSGQGLPKIPAQSQAVEIEPQKLYQNFVRAVTLNLSLIPAINQEEIQFEVLDEKVFRADFIFRGRKRIIKVFYSFDARERYPGEPEGGYDILFTRRTGIVFFNIKDEALERLKDGLGPRGLIIFVELTRKEEILQEAKDIHSRLDPRFLDLTFPESLFDFCNPESAKDNYKEKIYLFSKPFPQIHNSRD